jgi:hypothetical protein
MIAMVHEERLQEIADECLDISKRTEDARTASEMLRLSNRVLKLATPTMPTWQECVLKRAGYPLPPTASLGSCGMPS